MSIGKVSRRERTKHSEIHCNHLPDHNADQLVASLFALSRACIESAELFVTRQEQSNGVNETSNSLDDFSDMESVVDPYQCQLPTLQQVITQFQEAKRIHEDMKDEAKKRQQDIKYKYGIYLTPILSTFYQVSILPQGSVRI